ncbi:MAG: MoaD/ThiS family protein [Arenimonas sp.]
MSVTVLYFAALKESAGMPQEILPVPDSLPALYAGLRARHGFGYEPAVLRVALNGAFAEWSDPVWAGDTVAFIPPVSGG